MFVHASFSVLQFVLSACIPHFVEVALTAWTLSVWCWKYDCNSKLLTLKDLIFAFVCQFFLRDVSLLFVLSLVYNKRMWTQSDKNQPSHFYSSRHCPTQIWNILIQKPCQITDERLFPIIHSVVHWKWNVCCFIFFIRFYARCVKYTPCI
jgi:hypothetical protein